jgi:hypothetical protein
MTAQPTSLQLDRAYSLSNGFFDWKCVFESDVKELIDISDSLQLSSTTDKDLWNKVRPILVNLQKSAAFPRDKDSDDLLRASMSQYALLKEDFRELIAKYMPAAPQTVGAAAPKAQTKPPKKAA